MKLAQHTILTLFYSISSLASLSVFQPGLAAPALCPLLDSGMELATGPVDDEAPVDLSANSIRYQTRTLVEAHGEVLASQPHRRIATENLFYDIEDHFISTHGPTIYVDNQALFRGENLNYSLADKTGQIEEVFYQFFDLQVQGFAEEISLKSSGLVVLEDATYTACPLNDRSWYIQADRLQLDNDKSQGRAQSISLHLFSVPLLYLPLLQFPLGDKRMSGILPISLSRSQEDGFGIQIPIYWNIAPNQDATITPDLIEHRGLLLRNQYRFLTEEHTSTWQLDIIENDKKLEERREHVQLHHAWTPTRRWLGTAELNYVSDVDFLTDFEEGTRLTTLTHLENELSALYTSPQWIFESRLLGFQTIDETIPEALDPYRKLPQLLVTSQLPTIGWGIRPQISSELVYFDKEDAITGARADLIVGLSRPWRKAAGYFVPNVQLRHTAYELDPLVSTQTDTQRRTLPIFSVDGGVFLERDLSLLDSQFLQTLEPHLFYLNIPKRRQEDIPIFDTTIPDFNFARLFQINRFSGADRIGDTEQFSVAVTSRLFSNTTSEELIKGTIGQIIYLQDREVDILANTTETRSTSDLLGELNFNFSNDWRFNTFLQYDPFDNRMDKASTAVTYRKRGQRGAKLEYRFDRVLFEQTVVGFYWPVFQRVNGFANWNYSVRDNATVDSYAGFEYNSCCWSIAVLARQYVRDETGDKNTAIQAQLELKGLGKIGNKITEQIQKDIFSQS
ncbi:MAG TPA: hypothetical protein DCZ03_14160 [Gammaproteobacteria bacterium]|nr:hypothetical protein [Gammaproteobacteria bacterium]